MKQTFYLFGQKGHLSNILFLQAFYLLYMKAIG